MWITIFGACVAASAFSQYEAPMIDKVVRAIEARSEVLKSCSLVMNVEVERRSLLSGDTFQYAAAADLKLDRVLGRFRYHFHGQTIMGPLPQRGNKEYLAVVDDLVVFDGERTRNYTRLPLYEPDGQESGKYFDKAHIFPKEQTGWLIKPEDVIGGVTLAKHLQAYPYRIADAPGELVAVECITPRSEDSSEADYRTRIWFDVQKGMARQHERLEMKRKEDSDWVMYAESMVKEWVEVAPGLWLPAKYTDEAFYLPTGQGPQLLHRKVAEIRYSDINREFDPETFKLKFPPGITVVDNERGTTYKTAAITDATLDADARQAVALRDAYLQTKAALEAKQKAAWPVWAWPAIAAGAVACLGLLALFLVKAAKRPAPGGHSHA